MSRPEFQSEERLLTKVVRRCREEIPPRSDAVELLDLVTLELELARCGRTDGSLVGAALRDAKAAVAQSPATPWVYGGLAHLGMVMIETGELFGRSVRGLEAIDLAVGGVLSNHQDSIHCDLPQGALGLGIYGLRHPNRDAGTAIVSSVVSLIRSKCEEDADGAFYRVPLEYASIRPQMVGWRDLGLAHGAAGIVGFLSAASDRNPDLELDELLERFCSWLCAQASSDRRFSIFANHAETPYQGSRLAWCYGDLGVWLALRSVLDHHPRLRVHVEPVLRNIEASVAERPFVDMGIDDPSICHGEAGLMMVTRRMPGDLNLVADDAAARLCSVRFPFHFDSAKGIGESFSLLDGDVGVALALLDRIHGSTGSWTFRFLFPDEGPRSGTTGALGGSPE